MSNVPDWLQNAPGALEAATALVVDGNPQPARDWLEETQDMGHVVTIFGGHLAHGVFRVLRDDDSDYVTLHRAPELSMRNDK